MKYTCELTINAPRERVIELFDNPDNLKKWQPDLVSFKHISGTPGQPGAKSELVYNMNGRKCEMVETVTERALPDRFCGTYDAKGCHNIIENRFEDVGDQTRWTMVSDFRFSGMMRILGLLMRGSFPKYSRKMMNNFKAFVERGG